MSKQKPIKVSSTKVSNSRLARRQMREEAAKEYGDYEDPNNDQDYVEQNDKKVDNKVDNKDPVDLSGVEEVLSSVQEISSPYSIEKKFIHVKVGDEAMSKDADLLQSEIDKVDEAITGLVESNNIDCLVLVTHYAVDIDII